MGFWNRKRSIEPTPTPPLEKKSAGAALGTSSALGDFLLLGAGGNATTPGSALALYTESTAVSIPVNMVSDSFTSITPVIRANGEVLTDHPILDLLNRPSPFYTKELFFTMLATEYLVTSETYVAALGSVSRPPLELQPVSARNLSEIEGANGLAQSFLVAGNSLNGSYPLQVTKNTARYLQGGFRELRQIRGYSTRNNSLLRGQSPLLAASAEVRQNILGNTHNVSLLEKGGRVSLVFHFEEDMTQDDFEEVKRKVREQYGGAANAGTVGVTSGGKLSINEVGTNNKDMDFAMLQDMAKRAVALQYKVPLPLITVTASTFNNYAEARLALYDNAVLPLADIIFGGLTELLVPRYGEDPAKFKITYDMDRITALMSRRNEELKLRKELNIETDNELRKMIGREPYEGGDVVLKPANMVPAGIDLFTNDPPKPTVARDEEERPIPEGDDE